MSYLRAVYHGFVIETRQEGASCCDDVWRLSIARWVPYGDSPPVHVEGPYSTAVEAIVAGKDWVDLHGS